MEAAKVLGLGLIYGAELKTLWRLRLITALLREPIPTYNYNYKLIPVFLKPKSTISLGTVADNSKGLFVCLFVCSFVWVSK